MDQTTEQGYEPKYVAQCVLRSVLKEKKEITIATPSHKCAIMLRTLFPPLFFWIMRRRARNTMKDKQS